MSDIAYRIKQKMTEKGVRSMRALCVQAGVSTGTVKQIVAGNSKNPRQDTIISLAQALGCSPTYLMGIESGEVVGNRVVIPTPVEDKSAFNAEFYAEATKKAIRALEALHLNATTRQMTDVIQEIYHLMLSANSDISYPIAQALVRAHLK